MKSVKKIGTIKSKLENIINLNNTGASITIGITLVLIICFFMEEYWSGVPLPSLAFNTYLC